MAGELLALQPGEENIPANLLVHVAALVRKVGGGGYIFEPEALPAIHNVEGGEQPLVEVDLHQAGDFAEVLQPPCGQLLKPLG